MNTRPTPETDAMEYFDAMCDPDRGVASALARKLERERDEARDAAKKAKAYKRVLKETNAQLKRERDEARGQRDRLAELLENALKYIHGCPFKANCITALQSLTPDEL